MPIYEYQCDACSSETEVLQKISDSPLEICPKCGEAALRKKISAAAFRLKGSGWYETDFKTGKKRNVIGADSSDKSNSTDKGASGAKESGKSDSGAKSTSSDKSGSDSSGNKSSKDKSAA